MRKLFYLFLITTLLALNACAAEPDSQVEPTRPPETAISLAPTIMPTETAVPTPEPVTDTNSEVDAFIEQLKTAVINQDYEAMQAAMNDPIGAGPWRSQWQTLTPEQMIGQFQNNSLPAPLSVQFSDFNPDEITDLLGGQPVTEMLGPDVNVVAVLHSSGWGQSISDDALLFVTEEDGRYFWSAFLYTNGRFADANLPSAPAPAGLIYIVWGEGIYQVQAEGSHRQIANAATAQIPNLRISPNGRHIAYLNENHQLWLIDNAAGSREQLAADVNLAGFLNWGDNDTLFTGVWLNPGEAVGPNNGHISTIDIPSGELTILDETRLSNGRPAMLPDSNHTAFDVFTSGSDDLLNGRLYHPDSGLQTFDQTTFTPQNEMISSPIFNPSWAPIRNKMTWFASTGERVGMQVYDLETQTAVQIFDWDPARFGALIPSPAWSPDGDWLLLEVWANGPQGSGVWLIAADGSSQTLLDGQGKEPYWVDETQIVFGSSYGKRLYNLASEETFQLELPDGSWILGVTPMADLLALPEFAALEQIAPEPTSDANAAMLDLDALTITVKQFPSPDGRWQATLSQSEPVIVDGSEQFYTSLNVEDGATSWTPIDEWRGYGLGYMFPTVLQWSADGRYLYYANTMAGDGCIIFINATDLFRFDVQSGEAVQILDSGLTWNLALSPDEAQLAYTHINGQDVVVVLRDVASDKEQSVVVTTTGKPAQAGNIVWSPDGSYLLLTVAHEPCSANWTHSIVRVDVGNDGLTAVSLIEEDARQFTILEWSGSAQDEVRLTDKNGNTWLLDLNTNELTGE